MSIIKKTIQSQKPLVMGILNTTPDSFYDGGLYTNTASCIARITQMIAEGVDIIDIGAYSSRPGAENISVDSELERLLPIVTAIHNQFPEIILSVDTFRSEVVEKIYSICSEFIVNDISGGMLDPHMLSTCGKYKLPYVCMHMQNTPQTMQKNPKYTDVVTEIYSFFEKQIKHAKQAGIETIILDPGFGFGKTLEQNYEILAKLEIFSTLNQPILVGISRKSMIYKLLNSTPNEALNGSTILHTIALQKGAQIIRVHDIKEAKECIAMVKMVKNQNL